MFERFGDDFQPGDIYIVNDPFDGASHTPDIFIVKPVFFRGERIGFAVTVAHHGDIGGRVPGTIACDSTDVFQEGLRSPGFASMRTVLRSGLCSSSSRPIAGFLERSSETSTHRSPPA